MRLLLLVMACLVPAHEASTRSPQTPTARWGGVEVLGGTLRDREAVRSNVPVDLGQDVPSDVADAATSHCEAARASLADREGLTVGCSVVQLADGSLFLVADIHPALDDRTAELADGVQRPASLEDIGDLLECADRCRSAADRARAFRMFGEAPRSPALCESALRGLRDPGPGVRNYAAQFLNHSFSYCQQWLASGDMFSSLGWLVSQPSHTDRNKALATIQMVIQAPSFVPTCRWSTVIAEIERIEQQSIMPNVGGRAAQIMRYVRSRTDLLSFTNDQRECT